jgi:uncharacterized protein (DUF1800 family)
MGLMAASSSNAAAYFGHKPVKPSFPHKKMGLNERQAAAHLLNRFTFGIRPGDIDMVVHMGLEHWFEQQLNQKLPEDELDQNLQNYDVLKMDDETIVNSFLPQFEVRKLLKSQGVMIADSNFDKKEYRAFVDSIMQIKHIRYPAEYQRQLINQKILRAIYSNNQLTEVLTDFWFNHFNVSLSKNQCAIHVLSFERDVIRPNVLGKFDNLLIATAKSPAMLEYLDNNYSISFNNEFSKNELNNRVKKVAMNAKDPFKDSSVIKFIKARKEQGLNENYARELLELHTLGVDGGYQQKDVTEVAKIFTGWSTLPLLRNNNNNNRKNFERPGFIIDGDFLYRSNRHDDSAKTVLNYHFNPNGGYDEGIQMLEYLANDPATAHFICKKLAVRFVSDNPPEQLIKTMSNAFLKSKGSIKEVLTVMANSTYFWDENAVRKKIKTPFELTISAIRATNATVKQPYQIFNWCNSMGQRFYYYQAPTGFPDRADYWVNTSSLLNRMNFGMALSANKIPGLKMDSTILYVNHEPESLNAAIKGVSSSILPESTNEKNIDRVFTLITENEVHAKIEKEAIKTNKNERMGEDNNQGMNQGMNLEQMNVKDKTNKLTQIVGLLIGSPEFQKR